MLLLTFAGIIVVAAFFGGRRVAHWALGIDGAYVLSSQADETYFKLARSRRAAWRVAGLVTTYAVCVALAFFSMRTSGGESIPTTTVVVIPDGPAARAGMLTGDQIVSVNGVATTSWGQIPATIAAGETRKPVSIEVRRGQEVRLFSVTPDEQGKIRVGPQMQRRLPSLGQTLFDAVKAPMVTITHKLPEAWRLVTKPRQTELSGPIAIVASSNAANPAAVILTFLAAFSGYVWPLAIIFELILTPRRRRPGPESRIQADR